VLLVNALLLILFLSDGCDRRPAHDCFIKPEPIAMRNVIAAETGRIDSSMSKWGKKL